MKKRKKRETSQRADTMCCFCFNIILLTEKNGLENNPLSGFTSLTPGILNFCLFASFKLDLAKEEPFLILTRVR